jgi:hypothetical protein
VPTTSKVLFRGAASTTLTTTLYTVPSATTTVATNIAVTNTSATAYTFDLSLAGIKIHQGTAIAANTTIYIDCKQVLVATNTIQGGASNTAVNFHISGVEIS